MLRSLVALGALVALWPLQVFAPVLAPLDAVLSPVLAPLGAILTPVLAPRVAAFFPLVAGFAFVAQIDAQTVVLIAHAHALEIQLAAEVSGELRELLALLRRQAFLTDAHIANALLEQGANLGEQPVEIERAGCIARQID
jgi:hypothetical protein